jgi:hypothetical protein
MRQQAMGWQYPHCACATRAALVKREDAPRAFDHCGIRVCGKGCLVFVWRTVSGHMKAQATYATYGAA